MFETVLRRTPQCIEALAALAAIHTHLGFTNHSVSDSLVDRKKAKELYDQVTRLIATSNKTSDGEKATSERVRALAQDPDLFLEIARLSTDEVGVDRSLRAYKESARISTDELEVGAAPRLLNNIGVLEHQKGNVVEAQTKFEEALMEAGRLASQSEGGKVEEELDTVMTVVSFNHGVVSEAMGDTSKAKEAYDQILSKHPEYVDGTSLFFCLRE
jgi:RNA polymerase-associated protein CTR9